MVTAVTKGVFTPALQLVRMSSYQQTVGPAEDRMDTPKNMKIVVFSFGFKYGSPVDTNYIIDVRFLPNPFWVEDLKHKTGQQKDVSDYVLLSEEGVAFTDHLNEFIEFLVSQNMNVGKSILRIGIGCTGGRHRSVAVAESIGAFLREKPVSLSLYHRDIEKDGPVSGD